MIGKMNYLLLSTMMIAAIDSTFGRGCDCCKKLCADQDSSESYINSENNKTTVDDKLIKDNENTRHINNNDNTHTNFLENSKKKETLYFAKIAKTGQDENIEKCFNGSWYKACGNKVLLLKQVNDDDKDLFKVTGSDNEWEITDSLEKVLENADCKPGGNKWIIVEVTTLKDDSEGVGGSFIFYVDDIDSFNRNGVFEEIKCYSIKIIAANTRAVESMECMFYHVESALEKDWYENTPGLIGLDKLNVEDVSNIVMMFCDAIYQQATLNQLKEWRFSSGHSVLITNLFCSTVKGLNFSVLDDWDTHTTKGDVVFIRLKDSPSKDVFVQDNNENDFAPPRWYNTIAELILS